MTIKKRLLCLLLTVLMITAVFTALPFTANAAGSVTTGDCTWTLDDDGVLTISGEGEMDYYIGHAGPWGTEIKSVIIEEGVTKIGMRAFENCTKLTNVSIADTVTEIAGGAFYGCTGLTELFLPASVVSFSGFDIFSYCPNLTKIEVDPANPVFDSRDNCNAIIRTKKNELEYGCKNTIIPDSIEYLGDSAFKSCTTLTSVSIPPSVKEIGNYAFFNCTALTGVYITDIRAWCEAVLGKGYSNYNPLQYAHTLYLNNQPVKDVVIPDGTTEISSFAFCGCKGLRSVTIPDSVSYIGNYAFYDCEDLEIVTFSEGVYVISERAFCNCPKLASVVIPESVFTIRENAFGYNDNSRLGGFTIYGKKGTAAENYATLHGFTFIEGEPAPPATDGDTGSCTWSYDADSKTLTISGNGKMADYEGETPWHDFEIAKIVLENGVAKIGDCAFESCGALTELVIPDSVETIGAYAFYGCTALNDVTLGSGLTDVGKSAFFDCTGLGSVTIPENVTTINDYAFGLHFAGDDMVPVAGFTIHGKAGSAAQTYAQQNNLPFVAAEEPVITGDINNDGVVNGADAGLLNRYASGWTGYADKIKNPAAADINNDGKVNGADAGILSRYVSGWTQYARFFES